MENAVQHATRRELPAAGNRTLMVRRALIGLTIALVTTGAAATALWLGSMQVRPQVASYTELMAALEGGLVTELVIRPGERISGTWTAPAGPGAFEVVYPLERPEAVVDLARSAGVPVSFEPASDPQRLQQLLGLGIMGALFLGVVGLLLVQLRSNTGGRVGRRVSGSDTTFGDVAGTQGAAEELEELVDFLRNPGSFSAMGARVPKGMLLIGPPGTGKTLLARAVAGEAGVPFFNISGAEVTGFIVGLGAHRVRSLFRKARRRGGVIFIDEIDSLGGRRGRNGSHNEDDRTLNQLLVEMDGFDPVDGVVVIGATNRPEELDPALKRPGRFDRVVSVSLPTASGREAILRLHAERRRVPLCGDVDLGRLARLTPMSSGADLANLINEAAITAVRSGDSQVRWQHFEAARDRLLLGKVRPGFSAHDLEWRIVAYHEAGHALAGVVWCPEDGLHKVTIQPRGRAMGVAHFSPDSDRHLHSRRYLEGQIVKGLAGRAAEELVFGPEHITGGAESDLVHVNRIARRMVFRLGMGESAGLLIHDEEGGTLSPGAQAGMEEEVRDMLARLYRDARALLERERTALDALAAALLEHETLTGEDALRILEENGVRRRVPAS